MRCLRCTVFLSALLARPCGALVDALGLISRRLSAGESEAELAWDQDYERQLGRYRGSRLRPGRNPHQHPRQATFAKRTSAAEFCPTYSGGGWHSGKYEAELRSKHAPNGVMWTWEDCARECASRDECQFWTLQIKSGACMIMSKQGKYHESDSHIEGPKDVACLKAQPSGPYAGEYEVRYKGQMRDVNMVVHCNSSVSEPGVLTDFSKYNNYDFHIAASPAIQCLRREPRSTVFIFNTKDSTKFECLQQDGMAKLRGSRYYASGQLYGDVEYRLTKTFNCSYEVINGTNETVLTETIMEESEADVDESSAEENSDDVEASDEGGGQPTSGQTVDPATGNPVEVEAEAFPAEAWSKEEAAEAAPEPERLPPVVMPAAPPAKAAPAVEQIVSNMPTVLSVENEEPSSAAAAPEDQAKQRQEEPPAPAEAAPQWAPPAAAGKGPAKEAEQPHVELAATAPAAPKQPRAELAAQAPAAPKQPRVEPAVQVPAAPKQPRADLAAQAGCMLWCPGHTDAWELKCSFMKCKGCTQCAAQATAENTNAANESQAAAPEGPPPAVASASNGTENQAPPDSSDAATAAADGENASALDLDEPEKTEEARTEEARPEEARPEEEAVDDLPADGEGEADGGAPEEDEASDRAPRAERKEPQGRAAADAEADVEPSPAKVHLHERPSGLVHHGQKHLGDRPGTALASRAGSGMPRTWQEASLVQYLGWTLDAGLTKIKELVDGHWQKIQNLSAEVQASNHSNMSLADFLQRLTDDVNNGRQDLGSSMNQTLEDMKATLHSTGHDAMLPALEECLDANTQASTLVTWFFELASVAGSDSDSPVKSREEAAPEFAKERILALDSASIEFKHHEDALASRFRSTFSTLTTGIKLPEAAAAVPEAKRQLDELLDHVLQKATAVAWNLHSSAMDLMSLIKIWAAEESK